jgi:hypothetical protein
MKSNDSLKSEKSVVSERGLFLRNSFASELTHLHKEAPRIHEDSSVVISLNSKVSPTANSFRQVKSDQHLTEEGFITTLPKVETGLYLIQPVQQVDAKENRPPTRSLAFTIDEMHK